MPEKEEAWDSGQAPGRSANADYEDEDDEAWRRDPNLFVYDLRGVETK